MSDIGNLQDSADLFIVSSPSGGGKTTLINRAIESFRSKGIEIHFSISHTTRTPRGGETDGREYHFVDTATFREMIGDNGFLEHAEVHGNFYGTARAEVEDKVRRGIDVILDIDVQGAGRVKTNWLGARPVKVFVFPPSYEVLETRLRSRNLDREETIERRIRAAEHELAGYGEYDHVIINDDLDRAVSELEAIITARRIRPGRQRSRLQGIVTQFRDRRS